MSLGRREVFALGAGVAAVGLARHGHAHPANSDTALPVWPPAESFALWLGIPPDAANPLPTPHPEITGKPGEYRDLWLRGVAVPNVGVYRPANPDGRAVLVAPGGGYTFTSQRNEGIDVAGRLTPQGITVFVLSYRLPGEGWRNRANVPLQDAQRAMRLIRANAARYRIDPAKLGVLGFSAGGHLAGSLVTLFDVPVYAPTDAADRMSARPAYGGLMYAVSNMDAGRSHGGSRSMLMGPDPAPGMEARYAVDRNIKPDTPPLFLLHAEDDDTVPIANTLDTLAAARAATVPVEAHILERGGHGFGVRLPPENPGSLWPELFARWTLRAAVAPSVSP